jgi:hypothetical protein
MELNNENKHKQLTPQVRREHRDIKITVDNHTFAGPAINVYPGAHFIINGQEIPTGEYTPDNLPPVPPPATAEVETWSALHFSINNAEVLPFLQEAIEKIDTIIHELAKA